MPNYEYQCEKCGRVMEIEHSIKDKPKTGILHLIGKVPCDGKIKRLISKTSFTLKGGGWTPKGGVM